MEDKIYIGLLSELAKEPTEDSMMQCIIEQSNKWGPLGYDIASGKVDEGKVDELWAIKQK